MSELSEESGKQQNTTHDLIHKQCSLSWVNLSLAEQEQFQEMADQSNAQQCPPYESESQSENEVFQDRENQGNVQPPPPYENVGDTKYKNFFRK